MGWVGWVGVGVVLGGRGQRLSTASVGQGEIPRVYGHATSILQPDT